MKIPDTLRAVFFDWDGTLLNSFEADARAYVLMFDELGARMSMGCRIEAALLTGLASCVPREARLPARAKWDQAGPLVDAILRRRNIGRCCNLARDGLCSAHSNAGSRWPWCQAAAGQRVRRQLRSEHGLAAIFRAKNML